METNLSLAKILGDNKSGSVELLLKINAFLKVEIEKNEDISDFIVILRNHFRPYAAIEDYFDKLSRIENKNYLPYLLDFERKRQNVFLGIYLNLKPHLFPKAKIITISNSKTLLSVFELAAKDFPDLEYFISESRPVNEGRLLANKLSEFSDNVSLITEAMHSKFVEKSDLCIIGTDKILENHNVINKIGSKNLAILCKYYNKPFIVLSEKSKFSREKTLEQSIHSSLEIYGESCNFRIAENHYFEEIPKDLVTHLIIEE